MQFAVFVSDSFLCFKEINFNRYSKNFTPILPPPQISSSFLLCIFFKKNTVCIFKNKFICLGCVAVLRLSLVAVSGATLPCGARASHCGGFSCCGARALGTWASVVVARGLSSCGTWAQLLCGMWDLPGPGLEPVSPALAGRFLTTAPPGKTHSMYF